MISETFIVHPNQMIIHPSSFFKYRILHSYYNINDINGKMSKMSKV